MNAVFANPNSLTLVLVKPDGYPRKEEIIKYFENKGLKVFEQKTIEHFGQAEEFYNIHAEQPFFKTLVKTMQSGPVQALILMGNNAVERARFIIGDKNPLKAAEKTIRCDFGTDIDHNAVHGSDSWEHAIREIGIVFDYIVVQK